MMIFFFGYIAAEVYKPQRMNGSEAATTLNPSLSPEMGSTCWKKAKLRSYKRILGKRNIFLKQKYI